MYGPQEIAAMASDATPATTRWSRGFRLREANASTTAITTVVSAAIAVNKV